MPEMKETNEIKAAKDDRERVLDAIAIINQALPILRDRDWVVYRRALNFLQEHALYGMKSPSTK